MIAIANLANAKTTARPDVFQIFLQDEDGQNVLSIDDGSLRQSLSVDIVNTSGQRIEFQPVDDPISFSNYHFCLSFRPGTLLLNPAGDQQITLKEAAEGWQMQPQGNAFYVRSTSSAPKVIDPGERITLTLENIGAAPAGGSRGTRVEIKYNNLQYQNAGETISGNRLQYLNIVNQRGKKQIPLYVGFLGSNTILNDGTENELTLTIQSLPHQTVSLIFLDSPEIALTNSTTRWEGDIVRLVNEKFPNLDESASRILQDSSLSRPIKNFFDLLKKAKDSGESFQALQTKSRNLNLKKAEKDKIFEILINELGVVVEEDFNAILTRVRALLYSRQPTQQELAVFNQQIQTAIQNSESAKVIKHELGANGSLVLKGLDEGNTLDQAAKFTLSFDVVAADKKPKNWALVEESDADDIQILMVDHQDHWVFGGKEEQGITPRWSFICKQRWSLPDKSRQEILRLKISNLKTQLLSGFANLYIHYENIPGYWDGYITVPIHKGPLAYRETGSGNDKVGCVGIGTDEPQAKLHVRQSGTGNAATFEGGGVSIKGVSGTATAFQANTTSSNAGLVVKQSGTGNAAYFNGGSGVDITGVSGEKNALYIHENTTAYSALCVEQSGTGGAAYFKGGGGVYITGVSGKKNALDIKAYTGDHYPALCVEQSGTGGAAYFKGGGGVYISDVSEDCSPLHIYADSPSNAALYIDQIGESHAAIFKGGNGVDIVDVDDKNNALYIKGNNAFDHTALFVEQAGAQGIAATLKGGKGLRIENGSNWVQFEVYQDKLELLLNKGRDNFSNTRLRWDGDGNWDISSDIRLKTEIEIEENILNRLMQLNVKKYRWKDRTEAKVKKIGFIAQDIQPLFPSLVGEAKDRDTNDSHLTLKYAEFGVLAIGGLKELKMEKDAEYAELQRKTDAKISELRQEIEDLRCQIKS